jgi:hypothetical protein
MANIHAPIPTLKLNDGNEIPIIAYGTGTALSKSKRPQAEVDRALVDSIKSAVEMGYRHIDCAESALVVIFPSPERFGNRLTWE